MELEEAALARVELTSLARALGGQFSVLGEELTAGRRVQPLFLPP